MYVTYDMVSFILCCHESSACCFVLNYVTDIAAQMSECFHDTCGTKLFLSDIVLFPRIQWSLNKPAARTSSQYTIGSVRGDRSAKLTRIDFPVAKSSTIK